MFFFIFFKDGDKMRCLFLEKGFMPLFVNFKEIGCPISYDNQIETTEIFRFKMLKAFPQYT